MTATFTGPEVVFDHKMQRAQLLMPIEAWAIGRHIVVPAGFITDFASVPRIFWRILPPCGDYGLAAIIHDYLYSFGSAAGRKITRAQADLALWQIMTQCEVAWWKKELIYRGVRLGGWVVWNRYRSV